MLNNTKISIIIPAYNCEKTINVCLKSILEQTFSQFEIICVDDGSTDNTYNILQEASKEDKRIRVYKKENNGASSARNYGIQKIQAPYILFIDSDDYIEHEMLEKLYVAITNNEEVDMTMCGLNVVYNDKNKKQHVNNHVLNEKGLINTQKDNNKLINLIQQGSINGPYCKLFKSDIILKNNIKFNENIKIQEDLDFNINYIKNAKYIYIINEYLYNYVFINAESITSKFMSERYTNYKYVQEEIFKYFANKKLEKKEKEKLYFIAVKNVWSSLTNTFSCNNNFNFASRRKFMKKIIEDVDYQIIKQAKREGVLYFILKHSLLSKNITLIYILAYIIYIIKQKTFAFYK